jgi:hypothetical protein
MEGRAAKKRIEVLNWRRHGDDEAHCRVAAFPAGGTRRLHDEVDEEMGITLQDRRRWADLGDAERERILEGKLWYENDYIVFEDGDVIEHGDRKFRVRVQEVK